MTRKIDQKSTREEVIAFFMSDGSTREEVMETVKKFMGKRWIEESENSKKEDKNDTL
jgi:hypothetical protein